RTRQARFSGPTRRGRSTGRGRSSSRRGRPLEREAVKGPHIPAVLVQRRVGGNLVFRNEAVPLLEGDAELRPGEVRAQATVDPGSEAEVANRVTVEVDGRGVRVGTVVP